MGAGARRHWAHRWGDGRLKDKRTYAEKEADAIDAFSESPYEERLQHCKAAALWDDVHNPDGTLTDAEFAAYRWPAIREWFDRREWDEADHLTIRIRVFPPDLRTLRYRIKKGKRVLRRRDLIAWRRFDDWGDKRGRKKCPHGKNVRVKIHFPRWTGRETIVLFLYSPRLQKSAEWRRRPGVPLYGRQTRREARREWSLECRALRARSRRYRKMLRRQARARAQGAPASVGGHTPPA